MTDLPSIVHVLTSADSLINLAMQCAQAYRHGDPTDRRGFVPVVGQVHMSKDRQSTLDELT